MSTAFKTSFKICSFSMVNTRALSKQNKTVLRRHTIIQRLVVSLILSNVGSVGKMGKIKIPIVPFVAVELVSRDPVAVVD